MAGHVDFEVISVKRTARANLCISPAQHLIPYLFVPCLQASLTIVNSRVKVRFIHGHSNPLDYDKMGNNLVCEKQHRKRSHVV